MSQQFDPDRELPLLLVALSLVGALGTIAITLFWPYVIPLVTAGG